MDTTPTILEGRTVRLEPLTREHIPALAEVAINPEIWRWYVRDNINSREDLEAVVDRVLTAQATGSVMAWVTIHKPTNRLVGGSRFMDIDHNNRNLELGSTWLAPEFRGTGINTEAKYLQLTHAFETMGAIRVALKTHHQNLRSQAAMRKIGAKEEGTFRNHMIMPDGSIRHSVWFSIIREEWPEVKARLERMLGRP